jgi:hypothetical protein
VRAQRIEQAQERHGPRRLARDRVEVVEADELGALEPLERVRGRDAFRRQQAQRRVGARARAGAVAGERLEQVRLAAGPGAVQQQQRRRVRGRHGAQRGHGLRVGAGVEAFEARGVGELDPERELQSPHCCRYMPLSRQRSKA